MSYKRNYTSTIDHDLFDKVKMAMRQGETFAGIVSELLEKWLKKRKK